MRKGMWKKGLTVAMAAAMLAGPVSVPAVFNNGVAVVKADETNKGQDVYVLMNIPYADFYKAELKNNDVKVDTFTSATKQKTRSSLAKGSYHVNSDGSDITGVTFPVKVSDISEKVGYTSTKYFNQVFYANFQMTPTDYRFIMKQL